MPSKPPNSWMALACIVIISCRVKNKIFIVKIHFQEHFQAITIPVMTWCHDRCLLDLWNYFSEGKGGNETIHSIMLTPFRDSETLTRHKVTRSCRNLNLKIRQKKLRKLVDVLSRIKWCVDHTKPWQHIQFEKHQLVDRAVVGVMCRSVVRALVDQV